MFPMSKLISDDRLYTSDVQEECQSVHTALLFSFKGSQAECVLADTSLEPGHTFE